MATALDPNMDTTEDQNTATVTPDVEPDVAPVESPTDTPDFGEGYRQAAEDAALATPSVTAGYESPFTTDPTTGAMTGQPTQAPAEDYMTPETTVAGQLKDLLQSDSPLMQVTEAKAKERAAGLGMESSSMAVGAAQRALIETATPIAAQDAETAAKFKQAQQALDQEQIKIETEAQVAGELTLQKAKLAEQQDQINKQWDATMKGLDTQASAELTTWKNQLDEKMTVLQSSLNKELYQQQVDAETQELIMNQSQDMLNNYQITVQQLLGNQSFLESMPDRASMNALFNDMFATVSSSIRFSAKAAGVYDASFQAAIDQMVADNRW